MPQDEIGRFVTAVCAHIRYKPARYGVELELNAHLEDRQEDFLRQGLSTAEAARRAIDCMGNADELGRALDAVHRPGIAQRLAMFLCEFAFPATIVLVYTAMLYNMVKMTPYKLAMLPLDSGTQSAVVRSVKTAENFHADSPETAACLWLSGEAQHRDALLLACASATQQPAMVKLLRSGKNLFQCWPLTRTASAYGDGSAVYDLNKTDGGDYTAIAVMNRADGSGMQLYDYYTLHLRREWTRWVVQGTDLFKTSADAFDLPTHDAILTGGNTHWHVTCVADRQYKADFLHQSGSVSIFSTLHLQLTDRGTSTASSRLYLQYIPNPTPGSDNSADEATVRSRWSGGSPDMPASAWGTENGKVWLCTNAAFLRSGCWLDCGAVPETGGKMQQVRSLSLLVQPENAAPEVLTLS